MLPIGVSVHYTRLPVKSPAYETILHMADHVEEAAGLLAEVHRVVLTIMALGMQRHCPSKKF